MKYRYRNFDYYLIVYAPSYEQCETMVALLTTLRQLDSTRVSAHPQVSPYCQHPIKFTPGNGPKPHSTNATLTTSRPFIPDPSRSYKGKAPLSNNYIVSGGVECRYIGICVIPYALSESVKGWESAPANECVDAVIGYIKLVEVRSCQSIFRKLNCSHSHLHSPTFTTSTYSSCKLLSTLLITTT